MGLILVIAIIAVIICIVRKDNEETVNTKSTSTISDCTKVTATFTKFDENNPYEVYKITQALAQLQASIGPDTSFYVVLQAETPTLQLPRLISIMATLDDFNQDHGFNYSSYLRFGLSDSTAHYLASIPFEIQGDRLKYTFNDLSFNPLTCADGVIKAMREGSTKGRCIVHGYRHFRIERFGSNNGIIQLRII